MSKARWLHFTSLTLGVGIVLLSACASTDDRPGSFVNDSGGSGRPGSLGNAGGGSGEGGEVPSDGGSADHGEAGADGGAPAPSGPIALFPEQLQVDVSCGSSPEPTALLLRNGGQLPLIVSDATASGGYIVKTELPLQIAAMSGATLQITPPTPKATAFVGDMSSGTLSFVTNEADAPEHEVQLTTTLFGGVLEFTDGNGATLNRALPLTYLSSDTCPDRVKYRAHNSGNLAFTLFGPTFPPHIGGTSAGASGRDIAPDAYVELEVGGDSATDGACSASGDLAFSVQGSVCGAIPKLSVSWPANVQTSACTCSAAE